MSKDMVLLRRKILKLHQIQCQCSDFCECGPMLDLEDVLKLIDQYDCSHSFRDSETCVKCGWKP